MSENDKIIDEILKNHVIIKKESYDKMMSTLSKIQESYKSLHDDFNKIHQEKTKLMKELIAAKKLIIDLTSEAILIRYKIASDLSDTIKH